ncbi:histidine kinase N-terminal 7TM domain-containing diguanylate cyclase [Actinotalea solisilvae]|uniref:histidine kinase N-terminal 7TM domain-containing diguanylate cyclase n=1 Tax=Actinotalea solisilvae TaxID=2072922 RepID=UPI0018F24BF6|nr:diguanylate cyclase [Actinotalea solisilvae]
MPTIVAVVSLAAAVVATVTGVSVLRRRRTSPLALPLALMLLGASEWAAARALLTVARSSEGVTLLLHHAVFPGVAVVVNGAFWYFVVLSGRRLSRRGAVLLCLHPALLAVALVTNPWHEAFLRLDVDGLTRDLAVGPLYWVHTAYSYGMLVVGLGLAVRTMVHAVPGHRHVHAISAVAATIPVLGNVVATVVATTSQNLHLTPVFFLASGAIFWWLERYRPLSRAVPISTRQVLRALSDAVVVLDPQGRLLDVNPAARTLLRRPDDIVGTERVVGAQLRDLVAPELADALEGAEPGLITTASGAVLDMRVTCMDDDHGRALGAVVVLRDVTELERLRAELASQASQDALTGVGNRRSFEERLAAAVAEAHASGTPMSLALLDLDHFKAVNDTHGHAVGDRVLVEVALALTSSAVPGETIARIGGEEFVLLLPGLTAPDAAARAEEARRRCSATRVPVRGGDVGVTASLGVAELTPDGTPDSVLRAADRAMYAAKAGGRDQVVRARERVGS